MKYRPDIDGLRAIAVVAVILFHAGVPGIAGGYVGVDVFYVISGYLITSLILIQQDKRQFTLLWFYERRIRRIIPALSVVMLACAILGWLVMAPNAYKSLGGAIFATSIFLSNLLFWWRAGYFNPYSKLEPLLHTWSLAVEEQYYLTFPLLMMLLNKLGKNTLIHIIMFLAGVSFLSCSIVVLYAPISAFYLSPFRAWELFLGSFLVAGIIPSTKRIGVRNVCSALGLGMIFASIVFYSKDTLFPGVSALLPTCGSALFIWAGTGAVPATNRLVAARPIVFVGKISYSLYLWHYVLLAFGNYSSIGEIKPEHVALLVGLSFALAIVSYFLIEQPIRRATSPLFQGRALIAITASVIGVLALLGWTIRLYDGFPVRISAAQRDISAVVSRKSNWCIRMSLARAKLHQFCEMGEVSAAGRSFFVWGDSHAGALYPDLDPIAKKQGAAGLLAISYGCPPLIGIHGRGSTRDCPEVNQNILKFIVSNKSIKNVIMIGRWGFYDERALPGAFEQTVSALVAARKSVWIVGPVPEIRIGPAPGVEIDVPRALYLKSLGIGRDYRIQPTRKEFDLLEAHVISALETIEHKYPIHVVWPHMALCNEKSCMAEAHGKPFYTDSNHLSEFGAKLIERIFEPLQFK